MYSEERTPSFVSFHRARDKVLNKKFQGMQRCVVYLKAELKELVGVTRNWCSPVTVGRTIIVEKVRAVDRDKTAGKCMSVSSGQLKATPKFSCTDISVSVHAHDFRI